MSVHFSDFINSIPSHFKQFTPFATVTEREAWNIIPNYARKYILSEADKVQSELKEKGWPSLFCNRLFTLHQNRQSRYF